MLATMFTFGVFLSLMPPLSGLSIMAEIKFCSVLFCSNNEFGWRTNLNDSNSLVNIFRINVHGRD